MTSQSDLPNPGSKEALARGCTCPVLDNNHGAGIKLSESDMPTFWFNPNCPVHAVLFGP